MTKIEKGSLDVQKTRRRFPLQSEGPWASEGVRSAHREVMVEQKRKGTLTLRGKADLIKRVNRSTEDNLKCVKACRKKGVVSEKNSTSIA